MKTLQQVIGEAVLVALAGVVLGLAVNAVSPRGLRLTRDYFPSVSVRPAPPEQEQSTTAKPAAPAAETVGAPSAEPAAPADAPLLIGFAETLALYQDPRREAGLIVFVDARNADAYAAGHIPGSYRFDHYHPEEGIDDVLPLCQAADVVVVYCNGGDCEDSRLTAHTLQELGVPAAHLRVYQGGLTEWRARGEPVETGPRLSGERAPDEQP